MTYDDFATKLLQLKGEYLRTYGRSLVSMEELEKYLDRRLARPKKKGLRSLKGIID